MDREDGVTKTAGPAGQPPSRLERLLCGGRRRFYGAACVVLLLVLLPCSGIYALIANRGEDQAQRNAYLQSEVHKLDSQIEEVARAQEQVRALASRRSAVVAWQRDSAISVTVFNFLARDIPPGVQLEQASLDQGALTLRGLARSAEGAQALVRNAEAAPFLDRPVLTSEPRELQGRRLQGFTLTGRAGYERQAAPETAAAASARPAPPPAPAEPGSANSPWAAAAGVSAGALTVLAAVLLRRRWRKGIARVGAEFAALDAADLSTWGLAPRIAALLEIGAIAAVAAWLVLGSAWDDYRQAVDEEETLKAAYLDKKRVVVNLDLIENQICETRAASSALLATLPGSLDVETLQASIRGAARKAGVAVARLDPERETVIGHFGKMPVSIELVGAFDSIGAFVAALAQRDMPVTHFELAAYGPGAGKNMPLRFSGEVAVLRYLPDEEADRRHASSGGAK